MLARGRGVPAARCPQPSQASRFIRVVHGESPYARDCRRKPQREVHDPQESSAGDLSDESAYAGWGKTAIIRGKVIQPTRLSSLSSRADEVDADGVACKSIVIESSGDWHSSRALRWTSASTALPSAHRPSSVFLPARSWRTSGFIGFNSVSIVTQMGSLDGVVHNAVADGCEASGFYVPPRASVRAAPTWASMSA